MDFATLIIVFLIFWYATIVGAVLVVTGIHDKDKVIQWMQLNSYMPKPVCARLTGTMGFIAQTPDALWQKSQQVYSGILPVQLLLPTIQKRLLLLLKGGPKKTHLKLKYKTIWRIDL